MLVNCKMEIMENNIKLQLESLARLGLSDY